MKNQTDTRIETRGIKSPVSEIEAETLLNRFLSEQNIAPKDDFCDKTMLAIFEDEEAGEKIDAYIDAELKRFKVGAKDSFTAKTLNKMAGRQKSALAYFAKFGTLAAAACAALMFSVSTEKPVQAEEQEDYMAQLDNIENDLSAMATLIAMEEFFDGKNM